MPAGGKKKPKRKKLKLEDWEEELIEGSWRGERNMLRLFEEDVSDCHGCPRSHPPHAHILS